MICAVLLLAIAAYIGAAIVVTRAALAILSGPYVDF